MADRDNPKTVAELIAELQKYPPNMRVMGPGYEGGLHDIGGTVEVNVALNINTEWYYGPHEKWDEDMHGLDNMIPVVVVR